MRSGDLRERVAIDRPVTSPDGAGGQVEGWEQTLAETRAHFRYLRGGEEVQQSRLRGVQPIVITIRASTGLADQMTARWRLRDLNRNGQIINIRTSPVLTDDRLFLEITAAVGESA